VLEEELEGGVEDLGAPALGAEVRGALAVTLGHGGVLGGHLLVPDRPALSL
jgi:hypothetical protein